MTDPIFTGHTRPATFAGLTYHAFLFCVMVSAVMMSGAAMLHDYGAVAALIFIPLYAICRLIEAGEPRTFRLLWLAVKAKAPCIRNRAYWGGNSSFSPFGSRRY